MHKTACDITVPFDVDGVELGQQWLAKKGWVGSDGSISTYTRAAWQNHLSDLDAVGTDVEIVYALDKIIADGYHRVVRVLFG
jgi:hypothetical protein